MTDIPEYVWVSLDIVRGSKTTGYRGRMGSSDYEAIVSGGFVHPFVLLEDVHWVESLWNEKKERRDIKVYAFGQTGEWKLHVGSIHLRPESIATISLLKDDYAEFFRGRELFSD